MKLKQIVYDGTNPNLTKENKVIKYGEVFEVDDERSTEILNTTFKNKPVAELIEESAENDKPTEAVVPK